MRSLVVSSGMDSDQLLQQLSPALVMIGARNFVRSADCLTMRIGGNPEGVTHLRFTLEPTDTYKVEAIRCVRTNVRDLAHLDGVYFDKLGDAVKSLTGLEVRL